MAHIALMLWAIAVPAAFAARPAAHLQPEPAWTEQNLMSAEEMQRMLLEELMSQKSMEGQAKARDTQESALKPILLEVRRAFEAGNAEGCFRQLGGVLANLTGECEVAKPKEDSLYEFYKPPPPRKTCAESANDIFLDGSALVEAMQISKEEVAAMQLGARKLHLSQALDFLVKWLIPLARTDSSALLWAGFWEADETGRTTKTKLFEFAKHIDHATVHPDSLLGQVVDANNDLTACYGDVETSELVGNFWSIASMAFVLGMRSKGQGTVVALVNKAMTGDRPLASSVLFRHEVPTIGVAAWGAGAWSPQVVLVDLQGTCSSTSLALRKQLVANLGTWAASKEQQHWSTLDFVQRSRLQWRCLDCAPGACNLDQALARHVKQLVKAKNETDEKGTKLLKLVSPRSEFSEAQLQRFHELVTEFSVQQVLGRALRKIRPNDYREKIDKMKKFQKTVERLHVLAGNISALKRLASQHPPPTPGAVEALLRGEDRREVACAVEWGGRTALWWVAQEGYSARVARPLLEARAQVDRKEDQFGLSALMMASSTGAMQVVEMLLDYRANLMSADRLNNTALKFAELKSHVTVEAVLREHGAK